MAALISLGGILDGAVVFANAFVQSIGMGEQVADTAVGQARELFQMLADQAPQAVYLLWQDNAKLCDKAADRVVEGGTFFDEALPGAVQAEQALLLFSVLSCAVS